MKPISSQSDINYLSSWIKYLPVAWQPYALLCRLDRPIGTWLLFLPGLWGILLPYSVSSSIKIKLILLFALGSLIMRSAGCIINDLWDRDIDQKIARTIERPIAKGVIQIKHAFIFLFFLLIMGFFILLQLNPLTWLLGVLSLILIALYPLAKRYFIWPQLILGLTFGFGAPLGYAAATGYCSWTQLALYAATITWQIGFDTLYGYQDIKDDQKIGLYSTAIWANSYGRIFIAFQYSLCLLFLSLAFYLNHNNRLTFVFLCFPAIHFIYQLYSLDIHNPTKCLQLFKSNKKAGLLIALALLANYIHH